MIAENLKKIKAEIAQVAKECGRSPSEIKLVAVSKRFPPEAVNEAVTGGQILFGENYIQELNTKRSEVDHAAKFHFIGHLQTNKAKIAVQCCDMIETVDSVKLGKELEKQLEKLDKTMPILVQVNIGNDPNKSGIETDDTKQLINELNQFPHLQVKGLMTIPPFFDDSEESRPYFRQLKRFADELHGSGLFLHGQPEISMGMSNDFHIAIQEGATIVRVGTAIFGARK